MSEPGRMDATLNDGVGTAPPLQRVLVVEDEAFIAFDLADMLEQLGYEDVVICNSYASAEAALGDGQFSIAVFDLNLDGRLSTPLIDKAASEGTHVVIASGYEADTIPSSDPATTRIVKPYDLTTLRDALGR